MTSEDEIALVGRVSRKDVRALSTLYDHYGNLLYGLIIAVVRNREEAEDLLQELFVQIWEKADRFDASRGNVYAWLVTLARNRAIDHVRSRQFRESGMTIRQESMESLASPFPESPLDAVEMMERAGSVKAALQKLPPEQRDAIQSAYFGGFSQSEIAARLNIPLGTVKTRIRQGMKKLRSELQKGIT